jgi:hypothetical protein
LGGGGGGGGGVGGGGGGGGPPPPKAFSLEEAPACGRGPSLKRGFFCPSRHQHKKCYAE